VTLVFGDEHEQNNWMFRFWKQQQLEQKRTKGKKEIKQKLNKWPELYGSVFRRLLAHFTFGSNSVSFIFFLLKVDLGPSCLLLPGDMDLYQLYRAETIKFALCWIRLLHS
jgi:hypothetical protein